MAEEAIENELNCTICFDTYSDPKILQCFHVYCRKCLVKLVTQDQQEQLSLSCPTCRQVTPVPAVGTAGLPTAFRVNRLLDILDQHKKAKGEAASAEKIPSGSHCHEHGRREVELFCETCGELICMECAIKGGKHNSHDYKNISESFEKYKEEVSPLLEPLEKKMTALTQVLARLDKNCEDINHQHATIEAEIRESSKQLHEIISKRQDQLISQLDQFTARKLHCLAAQKEQIEALQAQLSSCLEFTKESIKTSSKQHEVLEMKMNILKQVQELATPSQTDIFTPSAEADVVFSGIEDVAAVCASYGRVSTECVATGKGTQEAVVGEWATVILEASTLTGDLLDEGIVSQFYQVELVSEITGRMVLGSVEQTGQEQYVISYLPTVKGRHQLHITADGHHIKGSPFCVTVTQPVEKLGGQPIMMLDELWEPCGVAVNWNGEVVVAEFSGHRVSVFSPHGEKIMSFGTFGSGKGQFQFPTDVAVDGEGNLLVLDRDNHRIQKFTAEGNFLKAVGSKGCEPLQFHNPYGITYSSSSNRVYVADTYNHRIQVLTSDLQFIGMFSKGKGHPRGIVTDSTGRVYVANSHSNCIQVFTAEGTFEKMFGRKGTGRGELNWPQSVGVDASGLVYVSEINNHRVSVFTPEGRFVTTFGSKGTGPGQLKNPTGLAVDSSGVVYVCDTDRIKAY